MKKTIIIFVVLLVVPLCLFGNGKGEYSGTSEESYYYRFRINDPERLANNKIFVSERVMKPGFEKYKKVKQDELIIYPLFNLDVYAQEENLRKNISEFRVTVPVTISKEFIQNTTGFKMADNYNLYVYLHNEEVWVPIGSQKSGIVDVVINSTTIEFTVVDWPVDDRMIASGR